MQRGVIYFLLGNRHAAVTAVSVRSLRKHYDGPLVLYWADESGKDTMDRIAEAIDGMGDTEVQQCPLKKCRRHRGYSTKPLLPQISPFDATIQLDGDTLIDGSIEELWPKHERELVLTQFSNWVSTGKRIRNRVRKWESVAPEMVDVQLSDPYPAINTGVLGYGRDNVTAMERWDEVCDLRRGTFINDEIAMQLLSAEPETRVLDCRWNYSVRHSHGLTLPGPARIFHFHGKKHCKGNAWAVWGPAFIVSVLENWAGMAEWSPAGDARLRHHLETIGCNMDDPLSSVGNHAVLTSEIYRLEGHRVLAEELNKETEGTES